MEEKSFNDMTDGEIEAMLQQYPDSTYVQTVGKHHQRLRTFGRVWWGLVVFALVLIILIALSS